MAPETLLHAFTTARVPVETLLRAPFLGGEPNAIHFVAAEVLATGGSVWTTNLDVLVERAAEQGDVPYHRIVAPDHALCTCRRGHLFKLHGSADIGRFALTSDQVLKRLEDSWRVALSTTCEMNEVAVVGYAGNDIDLRDALDVAFAGSAQTTWFIVAGESGGVRRFERLNASGRLEVREARRGSAQQARPDWDFIAWADSRRLTSGVPADVRQHLKEPAESVFDIHLKPSPLLQAAVLDAFGDAARAKRRYRRALWSRDPRVSARALQSLVNLGLVHGARWRQWALRLLGLATDHGPLKGWRKLWRWRLRGLTYTFRPAITLPVAQRALSQFDDDHLRLEVANAAKLVGRLHLARDLATTVKRQAVAGSRVDAQLAASATLNLSITLRWLGDLPAADRASTELADGLGGLASLNLQTWGLAEQGCVAGLDGRHGPALESLAKAAEDFALLTDRVSHTDAETFSIPILRLEGERAEAGRVLGTAQRRLEQAPARSKFREEALTVEVGELAREDRRYAEAASIFAQLASSQHIIHAILGLLGLGECQREQATRPEAAERALTLSRRVGMRFGALHALVTLGLADRDRVDSIEREIRELDYGAPERDDGMTGLLRFCLGPEPDRHLIAFP